MEKAFEFKSNAARHLVAVADAYCRATGESRNSVSKRLLRRGSQITDLANGRRDVKGETSDVAMQWLSDNWPEGADWPADVDRPGPTAPDSAAPEAAE